MTFDQFILKLEQDLLDAEMKFNKARSMGLDYEREFYAGKVEALKSVLFLISDSFTYIG